MVLACLLLQYSNILKGSKSNMYFLRGNPLVTNEEVNLSILQFDLRLVMNFIR